MKGGHSCPGSLELLPTHPASGTSPRVLGNHLGLPCLSEERGCEVEEAGRCPIAGPSPWDPSTQRLSSGPSLGQLCRAQHCLTRQKAGAQPYSQIAGTGWLRRKAHRLQYHTHFQSLDLPHAGVGLGYILSTGGKASGLTHEAGRNWTWMPAAIPTPCLAAPGGSLQMPFPEGT